MAIRIKIVPDAEPNAKGEWKRLDCDMPLTLSWRRACDQVAGFVPPGFHIVAMEHVTERM